MSPTVPPHPCTWPGCSQLVRGASRGELHRRHEQREYNARRGSSAKQGYGARWRRLRETVLERDGHLCVECRKAGRLTQATDVDHIMARKAHGTTGDPDDPANLQSLCRSCHSRKTAKQDGRWGSAKGNGSTASH